MPSIRAYADNVVLEWLPEPDLADDGIIFMPKNRKPEKTRRAKVIASGPGYHRDNGFGAFIPNEVKPGDVVYVDRQAGQHYVLDNYQPRTNKESVYGEGRVVRHEEILAMEYEDAAT